MQPDIRNVNLLIAAALVVAVAVIFASSTAPGARPVDNSAYMLYRQGEWLSVPIGVDHAEAYQIFRSGEVTSPLRNGDAYIAFRQGEVTSPLTNAAIIFSASVNGLRWQPRSPRALI